MKWQVGDVFLFKPINEKFQIVYFFDVTMLDGSSKPMARCKGLEREWYMYWPSHKLDTMLEDGNISRVNCDTEEG
jgi:hypothetical protein